MSGERVRSVDEEARLLAEALGRTRAENGPDLRVVTTPESAPEQETCPECGRGLGSGAVGAPGHTSDACAACPVCRGMAWTREHGPDALRSLADSVALVAEGLRVLAAQVERLGATSTDVDEQDDATGVGDDDGRQEERI